MSSLGRPLLSGGVGWEATRWRPGRWRPGTLAPHGLSYRGAPFLRLRGSDGVQVRSDTPATSTATGVARTTAERCLGERCPLARGSAETRRG